MLDYKSVYKHYNVYFIIFTSSKTESVKQKLEKHNFACCLAWRTFFCL